MKKRAKGGTKYKLNIARFMRQHPEREDEIEYLGDHADPYVRQHFTFDDDAPLNDEERRLLGPDLEEVQPRERKSPAERKALHKNRCIKWLAKNFSSSSILREIGQQKKQKDKDEKKGKQAKPKEKKQPGKKPPKLPDVMDKKHIDAANKNFDDRQKRGAAERKKRFESATNENLRYDDYIEFVGVDQDEWDERTGPNNFSPSDWEGLNRDLFMDALYSNLALDADSGIDGYLAFITNKVVPFWRKNKVPTNNPTRAGWAMACAYGFAWDLRHKTFAVMEKELNEMIFKLDSIQRPTNVTLAQYLFARIMENAFKFLLGDMTSEVEALKSNTSEAIAAQANLVRKKNDKIAELAFAIYTKELANRGDLQKAREQWAIEDAQPRPPEPKKKYDDDGRLVDRFPADQPGIGLDRGAHDDDELVGTEHGDDVDMDVEDEGDDTEDEEPLQPISKPLPFSDNTADEKDLELPASDYDPSLDASLDPFFHSDEKDQKHGGLPQRFSSHGRPIRERPPGQGNTQGRPSNPLVGARAGAFRLPTEEDYSPQTQAGVMAGQTMMLPVESDYEMKGGVKTRTGNGVEHGRASLPALMQVSAHIKTGKTGRARTPQQNRWVQHVRAWAQANGIPYFRALQDPHMRAAYYGGSQPPAKRRKLSGGSVSAAQWEGGCADKPPHAGGHSDDCSCGCTWS